MATIQCGEVCFQNIEAIIFDKDGTLADSQDFLRHVGQKRARLIDAQIPGVQDPLLMAFGLEGGTLDPTGLLAVGSRPENEIAAAAYIAETGRGWVESLKIARSAFLEADSLLNRKADSTPPFEGIVALLRSLATAGIKVGILSADSTANVQDFAQRYELDSLVQLTMGIEKGPSKPDPTLFYQACEALAVAPGAALMVGDSTADLEMAKAAKAGGAVGVTWGWTKATALRQADVLVGQPAEIQVVMRDGK